MLPAGLVAGSYSGVVKITPVGASPVSVPVTLNVTSAITLSCTPQIGPATVGSAYSATCTASGGAAPYTWSISPGTLPDGITLKPSANTATVSGTPTTAGSYNYTVKVVDGGAQVASQAYSGTIAVAAAISVAPGNLSFSTVQGASAPSPQNISVTSSGAALSFSAAASTSNGGSWLGVGVTSGTTPATIPVSIAPAGLSVGTYAGNVTITPASGSAISVTVTLSVQPLPAMSCTSQSGPGVLGVAYSVTCTANGGTAPYTWSIGNGTLPAGLSLSPAGATATISGTPVAAGAYSYSVRFLDSTTPPQSASQQFVGTVVPLPTITVTPASLAFTYRNRDPDPSAQTLSLSSTTPAIAFAVTATTTDGGNWLVVSPTSGQTPANLSVSVRPATLPVGSYSGLLTITALNAAPTKVPVTLTVLPGLGISCTPATGPAIAGTNYSATCTAAGGTLALQLGDHGGRIADRDHVESLRRDGDDCWSGEIGEYLPIFSDRNGQRIADSIGKSSL